MVDSRLSDQDNTIRRRRECEQCGFRFSTREETELLNVMIIKRDGRQEAYSREKIEMGLTRALEKRPITKQEFRALVASIERDVSVENRPEIKSSHIGEIVMRHLRKLDKVAYIRFASVYRDFTRVDTFYDELNKLVGTKRKKKTASRRTTRAPKKK